MFNKANRIIGGLTIKYLLEKTRVVALGPGERNYHVFYQIHQLPAAELASLGLTGKIFDRNCRRFSTICR